MSSINEANQQDTVRDDVRGIVNDIREMNGDRPVESLSEDDSLSDDLGFESLDLADLTVRIEDSYGVDVFEDGLVDTVGEILDQLRGA